MIVAGFEFTRTTSNPSSRSAFTAWVPEESNSHAWPMTIGPEPMIRIFLRSVRLGTQAPRPRRLFFDQPIDDRRLRHGLFTAIEDIVQTPLPDPDDLPVPHSLFAPEALAPAAPIAD